MGQPDTSQHLYAYLPLPKTQINPITLSVDCYWVREGVDGQLIRSWSWSYAFFPQAEHRQIGWDVSLRVVWMIRNCAQEDWTWIAPYKYVPSPKKNATKPSCVSRFPDATTFGDAGVRCHFGSHTAAAGMITTLEILSNVAVTFVMILMNQPQERWKT